ncbi:hypothetical protein [Terrabacter sp. BE26]|uniref:hypothetical protein n=1 Tax=Terrabacter sp. BE26 TaxID=2898152 RepID=UPI0035BE2147
MDEHVLNRRRVLLGTGAVAIGGVAGASSAAASGTGDSKVGGSWVISRKDDGAGAVRTTTVVSLAAGGVLISQDISPADAVLLGTWAHRGDSGFEGTMWTGQPGPAGPGKPGVTVRVRVRGTVSGDRVRGTYSFTAFDPSGAVLMRGTGSFTGRPIEA